MTVIYYRGLMLVVFESLKNDARQSVRDISLQFDIGVAITLTILTRSLKKVFLPQSLNYYFLRNS